MPRSRRKQTIQERFPNPKDAARYLRAKRGANADLYASDREGRAATEEAASYWCRVLDALTVIPISH